MWTHIPLWSPAPRCHAVQGGTVCDAGWWPWRKSRTRRKLPAVPSGRPRPGKLARDRSDQDPLPDRICLRRCSPGRRRDPQAVPAALHLGYAKEWGSRSTGPATTNTRTRSCPRGCPSGRPKTLSIPPAASSPTSRPRPEPRQILKMPSGYASWLTLIRSGPQMAFNIAPLGERIAPPLLHRWTPTSSQEPRGSMAAWCGRRTASRNMNLSGLAPAQ